MPHEVLRAPGLAWRIFAVCLLSFLFLEHPLLSRAQTATSTSQAQIDQSNAHVSQLKSEVAQLQAQLDATSKQKQTLQSAIEGLNLGIRKLTANTALTRVQIIQKDREINSLTGTISDTAGKVIASQKQVADSLQQLSTLDAEPLAIVLLGGGTLSSVFDQEAALASLRLGIERHLRDLSLLKTNLETSKSAAEQKRGELSALQQNLLQQVQGLAIARDSQNELLVQTKNKESNYQALIARKKAEEAQFEQDLLNYEGQSSVTVSPLSLPSPGPVLLWPLDTVRITQYFGNTPFATRNPQIYDGHGHTGIDLRASPGTPVKAARGGFVVGEGNTDLTCPYASFGKWIFIQHDDGLSTIYAHLAVLGVLMGQQVSTGQVIGYSDTTGYATGPHLHFGVYASAATKIEQLPTALKCKLVIPVAPLSAYLNPLTYLPPLGQ